MLILPESFLEEVKLSCWETDAVRCVPVGDVLAERPCALWCRWVVGPSAVGLGSTSCWLWSAFSQFVQHQPGAF